MFAFRYALRKGMNLSVLHQTIGKWQDRLDSVAGMHGSAREPHVHASARHTFENDTMTTKRHSPDWLDYPIRKTDGRRK